MRCTNNRIWARLLCTGCIAAVFMGGCGSQKDISNAYSAYSTDLYRYEQKQEGTGIFTDGLCVTGDINFGTDQTDSQLAEAAGVFNLKTNEVCYSQNLFEQLYPASTTKIMTAYIIIKNCNLDDMVAVSDHAVDQDIDSSVCGLKSGDYISVRDLLYGLLLASGNDAAVALAEHCSGSEDSFVKLMNKTAHDMGATGSHFTNPNGLPDEKHYTTVYDMYLIFQHALELDDFVEIISTKSYEAKYLNGGEISESEAEQNNKKQEEGIAAVPSVGKDVTQTWTNTNQYLTGVSEAPEGFSVVGGKTGTTRAAGYCLALFSYNEKNEPIISIVYKSDGRYNMYTFMNQILSKFGQ